MLRKPRLRSTKPPPAVGVVSLSSMGEAVTASCRIWEGPAHYQLNVELKNKTSHTKVCDDTIWNISAYSRSRTLCNFFEIFWSGNVLASSLKIFLRCISDLFERGTGLQGAGCIRVRPGKVRSWCGSWSLGGAVCRIQSRKYVICPLACRFDFQRG